MLFLCYIRCYDACYAGNELKEYNDDNASQASNEYNVGIVGKIGYIEFSTKDHTM